MGVLKYVVVVIIAFILEGAISEETDREGRYHVIPMKSNRVHRPHMRKTVHGHGHGGHKCNSHGKHNDVRKPLPLHNSDSESFSATETAATSSSNSFTHQDRPIDFVQESKVRPEKRNPEPQPPKKNDEIGSDFDESTGFAPRLSISENGDITFARSINFDKVRTFHDDDAENAPHDHDGHLDEDHDHFHKIRTARSTPQNQQQLASTLGTMHQQGSSSLNDIGVSNSATGGDYMNLQASGQNVEATHSGNSGAYGQGTVSATGYTTINSNNAAGPGWKS